jgi:hypothetical protein
MINNKRVLLICRESYSFPLFFIAQKMLEQNNIVGAFFIYPEESAYEKSYYNENTYYAFKEKLTNVDTFGLEDFCSELIHYKQNNIQPDFEFLKYIENEFSFYKNLNQQLISSQSTTRQYHTRSYYKYSTQTENLNYIQLGYKKVLSVIDKFKPDVILDSEDSELLRTILNEVAFKKNIPYINIDYPRYEKYKIPTFNLGLEVDTFFEKEYLRFLNNDDLLLSKEFAYVNEVRSKKNIMSSEFVGTITSQYKPVKLSKVIKYIIIKALYFFNVYIIKNNLKIVNNKSIIFTSPFKHFYFYLKVEIKKQILYRKNKYFKNPDKNEDYVYMPLHLIPESTTFVKAPYYINELFLIEQISKSLPVTWILYVKEHQAMIGERSLQFYKRINQFPNVKLVQFNFYNDPKPWIEKSKGVITISGSTAYEAAILGKKAIVFADVPFKLIDGVTKVNSFEQLYKEIASFGKIDNIKSCAAYIAAVKSIGLEIDIKYLISESESIINGDKIYTNKFNENISALASFYNNAFMIYNSQYKEHKNERK